ncbi:MAG: prepilin-type N-terminal cleavage/methylation domain-containing protein [Epsilonproteobacteria bacterium]|nr:hypothetical protein [Campylobacterota bacterium]NPA56779.1 prepilin-type N-terminal cleavage/methylation domain-containing protein [Campylobacterota bacterium]
MRRGRGFTIIELLFVLTLITILALVAIPKYEYLKRSAQASQVIQTTIDTALDAAQVAISSLEFQNEEDFHLNDIVLLQQSGWLYKNLGEGGIYQYRDGGRVVASIILDKKRRIISYTIDCTQFSNSKTATTCAELIGDPRITEAIEF